MDGTKKVMGEDSATLHVVAVRADAVTTEARASVGLDEFLLQGGFGTFQWRMQLAVGTVWMAVSCQVFSYLYFQYPAEWGVTKDMRAYVGVATFAGFCLGNVCLSYASDNFGRRRTLQFALFLAVLAGGLCAIASSYPYLLALRALVGFFTGGSMTNAYVLHGEYVATKHRVRAGALNACAFSCGSMLLALIAYTCRHTTIHVFVLACTCPLALWCGLVFLMAPESPRWLGQKGRMAEMRAVLERIARVNGMALPDDLEVVAPSVLPYEHASYLELFGRQYVVATVLLLFAWAAVSFSFYSVSLLLGGGALPGNTYTNTLLSGAVELAGNLSQLVVLDYFSCKHFYMLHMTLGGSLLLATLGLEGSARTACALLAKYLVTPCFSCAYLLAMDRYPTRIRNMALGLFSASARVGAITAPYLAGAVASPMAIIGGVVVAAGLVVLMFPEETKPRKEIVFVAKIRACFQ